ncbi:MAG: phage portal protein [Desulfobulbus sp.]|jgi:lambda family phage portal protein|uniref:phage portal protein n=1 Tax=Desulfobulbus sp. TaxID=895 RepID=UPI00284D89A3|nr:phage portal protein [Desulfobulbus sp.]MDR2550012.1 phage portal protein [Desulfobulbus sp.]
MSRLPSTIAVGGKEIPLGITLADRLVNWLNPVAGQERLGSRARTALLFGGYTAADKTRRANQKGSKREMDADTAIVPDLATLREDSQHLARNNPLASGALKTNITKVVGTGLRVKATIDRAVLGLTEDQANQWEQSAEREFNLATSTRELDLERDMPFSLLQGLVFLRVLEDGDLLVNMPRIKRAGSPYTTKLQLIEAARVCNPNFAADTNVTVAGVAKDAFGAAQTFHVCNRHPNARRYLAGKANTEFSWQSIPAFAANGTPLVLHLKDKTRPGQTRGVPCLAPVIELIKQLGRYTDAEVMAAVVSGMFTVFVYTESGNPEFGPAPTMDNPTGDQHRQADPTGIEMGYGSVVGLREGQKMDFANLARPNAAFDPFFVAIVRQIGMCLELPFEVLIKHFTSSYSAARAAFLDAWDYFYRRRHWLACQFCQPVYEAIVTEAVIFGRLSAPGFLFDPLIRKAWLGTRWVGDAPGEIDPLKAVNAAQARVNMHLTTLEQEYEELIGGDHEAIQPQIVRETNWKRENGLAAPVSVPSIDVDPDEQED